MCEEHYQKLLDAAKAFLRYEVPEGDVMQVECRDVLILRQAVVEAEEK